MFFARPWAAWRRIQYGTGFSLIVLGLAYLVYVANFYQPANCFDGSQNGVEAGVDCGGDCLRICAFSVESPVVRWTRSFEITDGQYNAVAYVENPNEGIGAPELNYTMSLYDGDGLIEERAGITFLPPDGAYPIFEGRWFTGERTPTRAFVELEPVDVWLPVDIGREQFQVVRREITGADSQPTLDATLLNNALTPTGAFEAVAIVFDANGNALTASETGDDNIPPRSEANLVFTWPEPIAKTLRSCEVPTDVVMAIDLSGSMNNDQAEPPEPITTVKTAAERFVSRLQATDQAALVTFATDAVITEAFANPSAVASRVDTLVIDPAEEQGSTNTGDAFVRAGELFASAAKNPDARRVMVILTDGLATAPEEEPEQYAVVQAAALKETGVSVYAIGLGEQVNMDFVRDIASPGQSFQALSSGQVEQIYQQITGAICEDGAAIIEIVPKTNSNFPQWP